jgi:hypothetical protein
MRRTLAGTTPASEAMVTYGTEQSATDQPRVSGSTRSFRNLRRIMQGPRYDCSPGELFTELAQETSTLVRQEVNLTKIEMSDKAAEKAPSRRFGE